MLVASGVCGASCIELELEAATHGCCVKQKRQRHGGRIVILVHGAVIQNLGFLGVLRRSCCGFAGLVGCGGVARWCGLMLGRRRRCRRRRRAHRQGAARVRAVVRAGAWFSLPLTRSRQPVLLRLLDGTSVDAPEAAAVSTSRRVRNHGPVDVKAVSPRRSAPLYAAFQGGPKYASSEVTQPTRTFSRRSGVVSTSRTEPGQRWSRFEFSPYSALRDL